MKVEATNSSRTADAPQSRAATPRRTGKEQRQEQAKQQTARKSRVDVKA